MMPYALVSICSTTSISCHACRFRYYAAIMLDYAIDAFSLRPPPHAAFALLLLIMPILRAMPSPPLHRHARYCCCYMPPILLCCFSRFMLILIRRYAFAAPAFARYYLILLSIAICSLIFAFAPR